VPETFVEILVSLIKAKVFTLPTILGLFIESLVSMNQAPILCNSVSAKNFSDNLSCSNLGQNSIQKLQM
jgi:hypothetical protein